MSEMKPIERMAWAMKQAILDQMDLSASDKGGCRVYVGGELDTVDIARAALLAIREPTGDIYADAEERFIRALCADGVSGEQIGNKLTFTFQTEEAASRASADFMYGVFREPESMINKALEE